MSCGARFVVDRFPVICADQIWRSVPAAAEASEGEKAEPLQVQQLQVEKPPTSLHGCVVITLIFPLQAFYALFRPQFNMLHGHNLLNVSGESPPDFNAILIDLMM